jgi:hypothetical protein
MLEMALILQMLVLEMMSFVVASEMINLLKLV